MPETIDVEAIALPDTNRSIDLSNATPMNLEEAEAGWARVNLAMGYVQIQLLELCRRKAWQAYVDENGRQIYQSWRECAVDKMKMSQSRVYQLIEAAEVQSRLLEAGVENSKILEIPESHIRTIAQAPETKQLEAFECLMGWKERGDKITQQDAEAAVLSVDTNKRHNKAEKLVADYIVSNRDAEVSSPEPVLEWAKEKKGLSDRQAEILADDVAIFVNSERSDRSPSPSTQSVKKSGAEVSKTVSLPDQSTSSVSSKPDRSLTIASELNGYEPEEVAAAFTKMSPEYSGRTVASLLLAPGFNEKAIAEILTQMGLSKIQADLISIRTYNLSIEIDECFGLTRNE